MRFLPIILFAILAPLGTFAQQTIRGEVRFKTDSTFLPGVNVVEKQTSKGVVTDGNGKFTIDCSSREPVLQFSFIGLKTTEIIVRDAYLVVFLEEDEEVLNEKTRFGLYPRYTSVGLSSGLAYTPLGINIRNALPMLFGLKMLTTTSVTYRTDLKENEFIDIRIRKDHLINTTYYGRYFNIEFDYGKRRIAKGSERWNVQELSMIPELLLDGVLIRVGYGRQSFNDIETLKSNQGFILGLGGYFRNNVHLVATAKKWDNYWQVESRLLKSFSNIDFEVGLCGEVVRGYKEIELLGIYRIHY